MLDAGRGTANRMVAGFQSLPCAAIEPLLQPSLIRVDLLPFHVGAIIDGRDFTH
jgi:hypothetical protein